jgi:hypothetical protein
MLSKQIKNPLRRKLIALLTKAGTQEYICAMSEFNLKLKVTEVTSEAEQTNTCFFTSLKNKIYKFEELVS